MPQSDSGKEHIKELKPDKSHDKGCATKHEKDYKSDRCSYRYQGHKATTGDDRKKALYELDFTQPDHAARLPGGPDEELKRGFKNLEDNKRTPDDPRVDKTAWHFGGENYKTAYLPFNHNYHHILPFESLKQLSYDELKLLQESGYNLNDGVNLIILPCLNTHAFALMLPAHPHNHVEYNKHVKNLLSRLKQKLEQAAADHKLNPQNVGDLKSDLEGWERDEYWIIVDYGVEVAKGKNRAAIINNAPVANHKTPQGTWTTQ